MNLNPPTPPTDAPLPPPSGGQACPGAGRRWLGRLLACNPFYLLSAALLLFGIYRVAVDPEFLPEEGRQLAFSFTALQLYEWLLVITAIVLARRALWYDSTLLAVLEVAFLAIPFLLVSQAALIDPGWVWGFCGAGLALACLRIGALRRFVRELNLPGRLLALGGITLLTNAILPVIYRMLHEDKVGTRPDFGTAFQTNECVWLAILPLLVGLAAFLPEARPRSPLLPGRRWLPDLFFGLLLAATGIHLWSLGYVYDFYIRRDLLAPALWVLAWLLGSRLPAYLPDPGSPVRTAVCVLPLLAALLPAEGSGNAVAVALCGANLLGYGMRASLGFRVRFNLGLAAVSLVLVAANWPDVVGLGGIEMIGGAERWLATLGILAVLAAFSWRHPAAGAAGAVAVLLLGGLFPWTELRGHWRVQSGLVFLLLHSLRWQDDRYEVAAGLRTTIAGAWGLASLVFCGATTVGWQLSLVGCGVGAAVMAARWIGGSCGTAPVLAAAALVAIIVPVGKAWNLATTAPGGVLAILGSLLLFVLGTLLACTRPLWQRTAGTMPPSPAPPACR